MDRTEWKLFLTNLLNKMPDLLDTLTSDAMRDKLKGIAYNVDEILDVTRKNVQDSAALLTQCAAEVLQTFDEELDLDAPRQTGKDEFSDKDFYAQCDLQKEMGFAE